MKKLSTTLLIIGLALSAYAQKNITMCHGSATEQFSQFASNKDFRSEHETPVPYIHKSAFGKEITFKAADGTDAYGYELKASGETDLCLFVFHEWWGLNEHVKNEAEKLYGDLGNVHVIALDLYDKKLATTPDEAGKIMQSIDQERARYIIKGAISYVGDDVDIATIGWCFGGGWSLQAAIMMGDQADACVIYYGMPEQDVEKLKKLDCDVLGIFGSQDKWIGPDVVKKFAENMEKADKDLKYKIFDADHAFANPSNPKYDSEATKIAYDMTIDFLKKELE